MAYNCFTLDEAVIYRRRAGDLTFINVSNQEEDNEPTSYFKEVLRNTPVLECSVTPNDESDNVSFHHFFISTFSNNIFPLFVFWIADRELELFAELCN